MPIDGGRSPVSFSPALFGLPIYFSELEIRDIFRGSGEPGDLRDMRRKPRLAVSRTGVTFAAGPRERSDLLNEFLIQDTSVMSDK